MLLKPDQSFILVLHQTIDSLQVASKKKLKKSLLSKVFDFTYITMMDCHYKINNGAGNVWWICSTIKSATSEAFGGIYLLLFISFGCSGINHLPTPLLLLRALSPQETFRAVSLSPGVCCCLWMMSCLLILQRLLSQTPDTKPWESGSPTAVWHDRSSFVCPLSGAFTFSSGTVNLSTLTAIIYTP